MRYLFLFCTFSIVLGIDACTSRFAHADLDDDKKKMIERCEFAVKAARIPPTIPLRVVCEKPFRMIDGDEVVTVVCQKFCKERGLK